MVRTQVQLTEEQASALKARAVAERLSMAELIRRSVDAFLRTKAPLSHEEKKRRALNAVGRFRSGVTDLSVNHDRYPVRRVSVFVDTSGLLAILDAEDLYHAQAAACWKDLIERDEPLVSTSYETGL